MHAAYVPVPEPLAVRIPDAVRISGLSRSEIYRRIAAGDIRAIKSGRRTLIPMESLRAADERQAHAWFEGTYRDYNIGIVTGSISRLLAIDVDEGRGKSGGDSLCELQLRNEDLPHTLTARTGGGGRHLLFALPPNLIIPSGTNVLGTGIDIRAEAGSSWRHPVCMRRVWNMRGSRESFHESRPFAGMADGITAK